MNNPAHPDSLFQQISQLVQQARQQLQRSVNTAMVQTYWQIGRLIIEHEQQGESRAAYGKQQLEQLSIRLSAEFGKGFDITNLRNMRRLYEAFPIRDAVRLELSWTHYRLLLRVENPQARQWYMDETASQNWSSRALERQIGTLYYERLLSSRDKLPVETEAKNKTPPLADNPKDYLRDPYVLDFLNLDSARYQETDLKQGIIQNLQQFLLEMGKGFAFVERQQRIRTNDDNPTIGLILCSQHNETVAKYSVLNDSQQLFASRYVTVLPTEDELQRELARGRQSVERQIENRIEERRVGYR